MSVLMMMSHTHFCLDLRLCCHAGKERRWWQIKIAIFVSLILAITAYLLVLGLVYAPRNTGALPLLYTVIAYVSVLLIIHQFALRLLPAQKCAWLVDGGFWCIDVTTGGFLMCMASMLCVVGEPQMHNEYRAVRLAVPVHLHTHQRMHRLCVSTPAPAAFVACLCFIMLCAMGTASIYIGACTCMSALCFCPSCVCRYLPVAENLSVLVCMHACTCCVCVWPTTCLSM